MAIVQIIYKKGEKPAPLTLDQKAMLNTLADLSDDQIDTSDDWSDFEDEAYSPMILDAKQGLLEEFVHLCKRKNVSTNQILANLMQEYIQLNKIA
jgi:hypothetical protein